MTETETPDRYIPEQKNIHDKDWLYEKYWGEMLSTNEIAALDGAETTSGSTISSCLREKGIPRREFGNHDGMNVSPFDIFYTDEPDDSGEDLSWSDVSG